MAKKDLMTVQGPEGKDILLQRFETHVPGLDALLQGGLFCGGIYMLAGEPGAGKTILANQMCYGHVKAGGRALYLTLLSETHARMLAALQCMSFFDTSLLGNAMQYIGGYHVLEADKLDGLLKLLRRELRQQKTTLLVLDGLVTAHAISDSDMEMKRFIHELQVVLEMLGCTALVLTGSVTGLTQYSQRTMVDGLIVLTAKRVGIRVVREMEVTKHRGSGHILGGNIFEITNEGAIVHPRFEALFDAQSPRGLHVRPELTSVGIAHLDALLGGGVMVGSTTLIAGPAGFQKLLFGLKFLMHGVHKATPALYLTSSETPRLHTTLAHGAGSGLNDAVTGGQVTVQYMSSQEQTIDQIVTLLLERIDALGIRRLFINGVAVLRASMVYPERAYDVFSALGTALQARGVTTLMTEDHSGGSGSTYQTPNLGHDVSGMVDYLLGLRSLTQKARRHELVTVVTAPNATDDLPVREFFVTPQGIEVAADVRSARAILSDPETVWQNGPGLA